MCCPPKVDAIHIGDDPKDPNYGIGFSRFVLVLVVVVLGQFMFPLIEEIISY